MEAREGIGREGWKTISVNQWKYWKRGVEVAEQKSDGLVERGVKDTCWWM